MTKLMLGYHITSDEGMKEILKVVRDDLSIASTLAFFPPKRLSLTEEEIKLLKEQNKVVFYPHANYATNFSSPHIITRQTSIVKLINECKLMEILNIPYIVIHPGSTLGLISSEEGIKNLAYSCNEVVKNTKDIIILVENMVSNGGNIMCNLTQFDMLFTYVKDKYPNLYTRLGTCLDTCHIFAAGYNIRERSTLEVVVKSLEVCSLKLVHFNDSKYDLGAKKDRHENLGMGFLGMDCVSNILDICQKKNLSMVLETPGDKIYHEQEIKIVLEKCRV